MGDGPRFQSPSVSISTALRFFCRSINALSAAVRSVPISLGWAMALVAERSGGAANDSIITSLPISSGFQYSRLVCSSSHSLRVMISFVLTTSRVSMLPERSLRMATCGCSVRSISRTYSGCKNVKASRVTAANRSSSSRPTLPRRPLRCQMLQPSQADSTITPVPTRRIRAEAAKYQLLMRRGRVGVYGSARPTQRRPLAGLAMPRRAARAA